MNLTSVKDLDRRVVVGRPCAGSVRLKPVDDFLGGFYFLRVVFISTVGHTLTN